MKHIITSFTVLVIATSVQAQTPATGQATRPAIGLNTTGMVAPTVRASELPPLPTGVNPFTGVTKAQTELQRSMEELKRLRELSSQNLTLQRDEIEALKMEIERRALLEQLRPTPKPAPVVATPPRRRVVAPAPATPPTPPQIITPRQSQFVAPEVLGVIDIGGQRVAMMRFDSQNFRVQTGSVVGGRPVSAIAANGIQWGNQFITIANGENVPKMSMTDDRTNIRSSARTQAPQPSIIPPAQPTQPPPGAAPNVTITPTGAQNASTGATGPTGVLRLPPPPPTLGRQ